MDKTIEIIDEAKKRGEVTPVVGVSPAWWWIPTGIALAFVALGVNYCMGGF